MPKFIIRTINSIIDILDEAQEFADVDAAYFEAQRGAVALAADEVLFGEEAVMVEIRVCALGGDEVARGTVTIVAMRDELPLV